jgi:hypothetical protein
VDIAGSNRLHGYPVEAFFVAANHFAAAAAVTNSTKLRASRLAPPMSPPSMSFWASSSGALAGFIEPP